ncbi:cation:proton antiporter [Lacticaseibacillus zhaodongensis]|uniref:cation:proton antiporter n=1 Tax=Lacticaseibacillus zhaodongensis TaxID=2668065 RepID=UPI0012D364C5|nr:sodium:proton antiporter [Lacticaseibacillus zhaodongensis]
MALIQGTVLLVCFVLLGNVIGHFIPMVPDALIQIALGLLLALTVKITVPVATDWFMLLFIAPLLYNDGRHFPRRALWALRGQIVSNAVFLVFATMFFGGFLIHALVPHIPFAAAVALGAILAPTDPIAVEGIAKRVHLPNRVLHLVAGESLINDASGLIGFKYGIAAALSGTFVFSQAAGDFLYISIVGVIVGAVLMLLINWLRKILFSQGIGDTVVHTVLQLITPFVIYLVAEEVFHASGVIAVVVAGLLSNSRTNVFMSALPQLRLVSAHVWDIVVYVLNGLIFVLLGLELPVAMRGTIVDNDVGTLQAIMYVLIVYAALLLLRFVWIFFNDSFSAHRRGKKARPISALLSAVAGARGAITVIGVLGLPYEMINGTAFPERSLMLFIAAGVTLTSLIVATMALPLLVQLLPHQTPIAVPETDTDTKPEDDSNTAPRKLTRAEAESYVLQAAIKEIRAQRRDDMQKPAFDLIAEYQRRQRRVRLSADSGHSGIPLMVRDELEMKIMGTQGELQAVAKMRQDGKISTKMLDHTEKRLRLKLHDLQYMQGHDGKRTVRMHWQQLRGRIRHTLDFLQVFHRMGGSAEYRQVLQNTAKGALHNMTVTLKSPDYKHRKFSKQVVYTQFVHYRNRIETVRVYGKTKHAHYDTELQRLRMIAFTAERAAVHQLMEDGYITPITAQHLSSNISYSENAVSLRAADEDE